jgi:hypothetical protein
MLRIAETLADSAHRQIAALAQLPIEGGEQRVDRAGARQLLAEQPDRVLVGRDSTQVEPKEP